MNESVTLAKTSNPQTFGTTNPEIKKKPTNRTRVKEEFLHIQ